MRQLIRGRGAPSAWQGSRAVWFMEAFTTGGPGRMLGTARGGHRGNGCRASSSLREGWGTLTVDVHVEVHAGAACGIAGCTAIVADISQAQILEP